MLSLQLSKKQQKNTQQTYTSDSVFLDRGSEAFPCLARCNGTPYQEGLEAFF